MKKQDKKLPEKKLKPSEEIARLEMNNAILTQALYMQYDDMDELQNLIASVIDSMEVEGASIYRAKYALKAIRSLVIHQQYSTMDCAGLEY